MGLVIVGDIMLGRRVTLHLDDVVNSVAAMQHKMGAAVWVGNLECPVCHAQPTRPTGFRSSPDAATPALRLFDLLSVANNHALDCGHEGFFETLEHLRRLRVKVVGYRNAQGWQDGEVVEVGGRRIGFLGYVDPNLLPILPPSELATCDDLLQVSNELQRLRNRADFVVCLLHAGDEMVRFPFGQERVLPKVLADMGFDMIVRSHAHVPQGYERLGQTHVLYGLGDFIFDSRVLRRTTGLAAIVDWSNSVLSVHAVRVRRDHRFRVRTLGVTAYPAIPRFGEGVLRKLDLGVYYLERAFSLIWHDRSQGLRHIYSRIFR